MIQDLGDKKLDNAYQNQTPEPGDQFFRFDRDKILVKTLPGGRLLLPTAGEPVSYTHLTAVSTDIWTNLITNSL